MGDRIEGFGDCRSVVCGALPAGAPLAVWCDLASGARRSAARNIDPVDDRGFLVNTPPSWQRPYARPAVAPLDGHKRRRRFHRLRNNHTAGAGRWLGWTWPVGRTFIVSTDLVAGRGGGCRMGRSVSCGGGLDLRVCLIAAQRFAAFMLVIDDRWRIVGRSVSGCQVGVVDAPCG